MSPLPEGGAERVVHDIHRRTLANHDLAQIPVSQSVHNPRAEPMVTAIRTGGGRMQRILDQAQITTTVWHEDPVEAERIARLLLEGLQGACRAEAGRPRITRFQDLSFYYDPIDRPPMARYTFTSIVTIRAM